MLDNLIVGSLLVLALSSAVVEKPVGQRQVEPLLTVLDVRDVLAAGNRTGQTVRVLGIVSDTCGRSCELRTTLGGWERGSETVSLASGTPVEAHLQSLAGKRVVIRARIGESAVRALPSGDIQITTDRAPELIPIEIEE